MTRKRPATPAPASRSRSAEGRQRAPGRPPANRRSADGDVRERLLDAAIACYVRGGIAATSLREIAAEAHVTPALLHYYFGDKAQLQAAVVDEKLLPALAQLREPLEQAGGDVAALVAGFVAGIGRIAIAHPWLPPLWVRKVLCEGGALRDVLFEHVGPAIPRMMATRFAAAQADGGLNPDLDPRLLMVSLIGLTMFPMASAPIWRQLFGADDIDFNDLRRHTLVLLDRGLELDHAK